MANYDYFSAPKNMQPRILKRLVIGQKENSSSWKDKPFPFSSDSSLQGLIIFIWVMLIFGPVARTSCGRVCPGWNFWIFFNRFSVLLQFSWGLEIYDFLSNNQSLLYFRISFFWNIYENFCISNLCVWNYVMFILLWKAF
jgi:hypothetical protein